MKQNQRFSYVSVSILITLMLILAFPSVAFAGERIYQVTDLGTLGGHGDSGRMATTSAMLWAIA